MDFEKLKEALAVFNLADRASLKEIKARHRELVKQHHPDRKPGEESAQIRAINEAYSTLREYCDNYRFSFSREEFFEQNPEERLRAQFAYDPLWGSRGPAEE